MDQRWIADSVFVFLNCVFNYLIKYIKLLLRKKMSSP